MSGKVYANRVSSVEGFMRTRSETIWPRKVQKSHRSLAQWGKCGRSVGQEWQKYRASVAEVQGKRGRSAGQAWQKCRASVAEVWFKRARRKEAWFIFLIERGSVSWRRNYLTLICFFFNLKINQISLCSAMKILPKIGFWSGPLISIF